jgi:hypothetical protein
MQEVIGMETMKYRGPFYRRLYERHQQARRQLGLLDWLVFWCLG